jgi:hypothetical protein
MQPEMATTTRLLQKAFGECVALAAASTIRL